MSEAAAMTNIPTIDLRALAPEQSRRNVHLDELRRALGTIGACYLVLGTAVL
jgi:hypothetical protein